MLDVRNADESMLFLFPETQRHTGGRECKSYSKVIKMLIELYRIHWSLHRILERIVNEGSSSVFVCNKGLCLVLVCLVLLVAVVKGVSTVALSLSFFLKSVMHLTFSILRFS